MEMKISLGPEHQVRARWENFEVITDQPASHGGQGLAPSPFELFLASLATCAGYYVMSFCRSRDIPVENLGLAQRLVPTEDGKDIAAIELEVVLPPEFPAKYEKAVLRAAGMCRVKKTILNPPEMRLSARWARD